jgi:hypothetical protein
MTHDHAERPGTQWCTEVQTASTGGQDWAEAHEKIARMTLTIKLDRNWSSFQLANSAPPLSVTDSAIAPSARMPLPWHGGGYRSLKLTTATPGYRCARKLGLFRRSSPCPRTSRHAEACATCKSGSTKRSPHSHCAGQKCQYVAQRITIAEILCKYSRPDLVSAAVPDAEVDDRDPWPVPANGRSRCSRSGAERQVVEHWGARPRKNSEIHIDVSHSRQPLVKGERLVRYEVNTVIRLAGWTPVPAPEVNDRDPLPDISQRPDPRAHRSGLRRSAWRRLGSTHDVLVRRPPSRMMH